VITGNYSNHRMWTLSLNVSWSQDSRPRRRQ